MIREQRDLDAGKAQGPFQGTSGTVSVPSVGL